MSYIIHLWGREMASKKGFWCVGKKFRILSQFFRKYIKCIFKKYSPVHFKWITEMELKCLTS